MGLFKEISFFDFEREFIRYDRQDQFSREGLSYIYDLLEELSLGTGEDIPLDVISICCDFTEYRDKEEAFQEHGVESLEELRDYTLAEELENGGVIIQNY